MNRDKSEINFLLRIEGKDLSVKKGNPSAHTWYHIQGSKTWAKESWKRQKQIWSILGKPDFAPSLVARLVKNLPARQETLVWFLDWEDPLEKR